MGKTGKEKALTYAPESIEELAKFITENDWSPFMYSQPKRHSDFWESCSILAIDVDNDGRTEECSLEKAKELFKGYAHIISTSKSHQIEKHGKVADRFRVILFLEEPVTDPARYKQTWLYTAEKFPFIDPQCKDLARFFFRSTDVVSINEDGMQIPISEAKEVIKSTTLVPKGSGLLFDKGTLSKATLQFMIDGARTGEWNISLFKAAKDFQEQGYTEEEAIERLMTVTGELDSNDMTTIQSAYSNEPKYTPRGAASRPIYTVPSALQMKLNPKFVRLGDPVKGPSFIDCLQEPWRKTEVLGLLAAPGTGKTQFSLKIFLEMIKNNPQNDDIYVFFSLEMGAAQVLRRWEKLTRGEPKLYERLYVVANEDEENNPRHINLQKIYWFCKDISAESGKAIGAICIDHVGIVNNTVDITKKPNFGVEGELDGAWGNIKSLSHATLCTKFKEIAKMLNCFVIVQSQTTKSKAGDGDTPIDKGGAFGAAQFEWDVHYLVSIWQPLLRVNNETDLRVTAWQYAKVREQEKNDKVTLFDPRMLYFDMETGDMRPMNELEEETFYSLINKADELRKNAIAKKQISYKNSPIDVRTLKLVTKPLITKSSGGSNNE